MIEEQESFCYYFHVIWMTSDDSEDELDSVRSDKVCLDAGNTPDELRNRNKTAEGDDWVFVLSKGDEKIEEAGPASFLLDSRIVRQIQIEDRQG